MGARTVCGRAGFVARSESRCPFDGVVSCAFQLSGGAKQCVAVSLGVVSLLRRDCLGASGRLWWQCAVSCCVSFATWSGAVSERGWRDLWWPSAEAPRTRCQFLLRAGAHGTFYAFWLLLGSTRPRICVPVVLLAPIHGWKFGGLRLARCCVRDSDVADVLCGLDCCGVSLFVCVFLSLLFWFPFVRCECVAVTGARLVPLTLSFRLSPQCPRPLLWSFKSCLRAVCKASSKWWPTLSDSSSRAQSLK